VVQVNGKVRSKLDVPASTTEEELKKAVLADEKTKTWIGTKPVRKIIVVPKKLINIVV
jgi:leucyl-tRNA synthetase